jgi:hypothetical protein
LAAPETESVGRDLQALGAVNFLGS